MYPDILIKINEKTIIITEKKFMEVSKSKKLINKLFKVNNTN